MQLEYSQNSRKRGVSEMKLVWVVKVEGRRCLHEHFSEALDDFKSHDSGSRLIYPKFISNLKWKNIPDFTGW